MLHCTIRWKNLGGFSKIKLFMQIVIIFNPASYRGDLFNYKKEFIKNLLQSGGNNRVKILVTKRRGEATYLARNSIEEGCEIILAAGGDGTINEIVNAVVGGNVKMGIIPLGISNVFARSLNLPLEITKSVEVVLKGTVRKVDVGKTDSRLFVLMTGAGLDAYAVHRANLKLKKWLGKWVYGFAGFVHYPEYTHREIKVFIDGYERSRGFHVIVANSPLYGGSYRIAPDAKLDDGFLDVCIFTKKGPLHDLRYVYGVITGTHFKFPDVKVLKAKKIRLEGEEVPYHLDSEPIGKLPVDIEVIPKALDVIVP
jgi:YegS/Rv2252/BmrU family lipid kinase